MHIKFQCYRKICKHIENMEQNMFKLYMNCKYVA